MLRKLLSPFLAITGLVLIMLLSFTATAWAAGAATPDDGSLLDILRPVYDAFHAGHYVAAGALAVVVAVALAKRYAGSGAFGKFIGSDIGGTVATLVASFAGSIAAVTGSGDAWHWSMVSTAGLVAIAAAGGYTVLKKLVVDPLVKSAWYQNKAPGWLKAAMGMVLWIFDKPAASAAAIKASEDAGAAAVKAAPSEGAAKIAGPGEKF